MGKDRMIYVCSECGHSAVRWQGQCSGCGEWNTLVLEKTLSRSVRTESEAVLSLLEDVDETKAGVFSTSVPGLDLVLGQGLVPGGVVLLSGEPGIGKSTLLLQLAYALTHEDRRAAYVSGEESLSQLRVRAKRLGLLGGQLAVMATNSLDDVLPVFKAGNHLDVLILDSVQTMDSGRTDGVPGSPAQVRAVAAEIIEKAKQTGTAVILVGHVTKDGQIAGPKVLEHMVDTVLYLEGDRQHLYRMLRVVKNRFGPSDELLVLEMVRDGLRAVEDPATFFLQARDPGLSGTALAMAAEGHRAFAVEIQALVTKSYLAFPRRTSVGFESNRLNLILAVLEKRLKLNLSQMDIYVKIGGGLKLSDPGLDLALAVAVLSSMRDKALPEGAVFWGEVDLNGQVRPVFSQAIRMRQTERLGYNPVFHPRSNTSHNVGWTRIVDVCGFLFS